MIVGLGLDVVELERIGRSVERFGQRFLDRILSDGELAGHAARPLSVASLAARFAAKEAASKALGTGFAQGVTPRSFEVRTGPGGKPEIVFLGEARRLAEALGATRLHLSLTHGRDVAAAVVILETGAR